MDSHIPVLLNQVLELLAPAPGKVFIDCTLGVGGHTEAIAKALNGTGSVYGIEVDERNLALAQERLKGYSNVHFIRDNFENLGTIADDILTHEKHIDGILFDLGLSSLHTDNPERGFSFQSDGPLDMRFDTRSTMTAADILNTYSLEDLLFIFQTYGEEKFAYRIAYAIVEHRRNEPFTRTAQLVDLVSSCVPRSKQFFTRNPATRIFQSLRIATNREIEVLGLGIAAAIEKISSGGRIAVISYHSLEDRIIKNVFRDGKKEGTLNVITKRPIVPEESEIELNRRSRSAKLRVAEKI